MRTFKNFLIGLVLVVLGIMAMMLIPSPQGDADKPWEITTMPDGNSKVLGIHLGKTDYRTAQDKLGEFGQTALFEDEDGSLSVEAFFDSTNLGGLSAKVVLNLGVESQQLQPMLKRAQNGKLQPSGAHQYELAEADRQQLLSAPVTVITYMPTLRLAPEMIRSRFGEPDKKVTTNVDEEGGKAETWLYTSTGLSIVFQGEQKPILIYRALN
jgi:hypothetical protein